VRVCDVAGSILLAWAINPAQLEVHQRPPLRVVGDELVRAVHLSRPEQVDDLGSARIGFQREARPSEAWPVPELEGPWWPALQPQHHVVDIGSRETNQRG